MNKESSDMTHSQLQRARALALPTREATLRRDASVSRFWKQNQELLGNAWREWEEREKDNLPALDDTLMDARLREAVAAAWEDPTTEGAVEDLWQRVSPGVFKCQFFDPKRLTELRGYLEAVSRAKIPVRPPYGIVLNRHGAMLDRRSLGYLAAPAFQDFYGRLINRYMRPVSRLLFPEVTGFDTQSFGFSIEYQPGMDTSIRPHTDASATTLNINLNLPSETFSGSGVDFFNPRTRRPSEFVFEPGMAVIHRGNVVHAAQPITDGGRSNFVLWLYGEQGRMPPWEAPAVALDAQERWTTPLAVPDDFAPF